MILRKAIKKIPRRARIDSVSGPVAAAAAIAAYALLTSPYGCLSLVRGGAVVATFYAALGVVAGLLRRSALHTTAGVNAGVLAGVVWGAFMMSVDPMYVRSLSSGHSLILLTGTTAAFGGIFFWADRRKRCVAAGVIAGALSWGVALVLAVPIAYALLLLLAFLRVPVDWGTASKTIELLTYLIVSWLAALAFFWIQGALQGWLAPGPSEGDGEGASSGADQEREIADLEIALKDLEPKEPTE